MYYNDHIIEKKFYYFISVMLILMDLITYDYLIALNHLNLNCQH